MQLYQALITLDGWTFVAQICNLMIQLVIFKKLLLNPVKKVVAERKAKADSQIADAQKLRTEAEAMKAEYEQNLQNARTEANQIVAAAQKTATARSEEFRTAEGQAKAAGVCKLLGLDGIVAIGGDGTFRGAQELSKCGVSVVGIPGTIDNDIVCTDYSIGFDTAANTAVECIDKLRDTMQSHERCAVVEVMGRHAGYLALYVGVAVGATAVLVPEHPYDFKVQVADNIRHARLNGKTNFMIVVAEGAASAVEVGRQIQEELALDPRVTILGHIQRGGSPTAKDRVMATRMGYEAVRVLAEGKTNRVICAKDDQIIDLDIDEGLAMKKTLNSEEFKVMTVMTGM